MNVKRKLNEQDTVFPVTFNGKQYYEKDCNDAFLAFYSEKEALNFEGGVYMAEGTWVYPDGSMGEF